MRSWGGLLRKEWLLMRWTLITLVLVNMAISFFSIAPMAVGAIANIGLELKGLAEMWSTIHIFFAAALFLQSLHTDMKQPDVWFHSPATIWRLLGSKVVMSIILVLGSLLICGVMAGIAYYIGGFVEVSHGFTNVSMAFQTLVNILVTALFFISVSLMIWVVYKILVVKVGWFAGVIVFFLIIFGQILWGILALMWDIMGMTSTFLYIGIFLLLYSSGSLLLEKKVRY